MRGPLNYCGDCNNSWTGLQVRCPNCGSDNTQSTDDPQYELDKDGALGEDQGPDEMEKLNKRERWFVIGIVGFAILVWTLVFWMVL